MDKEILKETILRRAKLDLFDGVGRIIVAEFLEDYGATEQELLEALAELKYDYRFSLSDKMVLIYFSGNQEQRLKSRIAERIQKQGRR